MTPARRNAPRPDVDWERIEVDYRANVKTLREIADEHGISHGSITKRATRDGWDRDLRAKIRAKADALVSKALASTAAPTVSKAAELDTVQAEAQVQATIRIEQRADVRRARALVAQLIAELEQATGQKDLLAQLGEIMAGGDSPKMGEAFEKVMSLSGRTQTVAKLSEALQRMIDLESRVFGLEDRSRGAAGFDALIDAVAAELDVGAR